MQRDSVDMAEYWNEAAGPKWVAQQERLDRQFGGLGRDALDLAAPRAGEQILDVGCGCGDTTLALATAVAPGGQVTALDLSRPMLDRARQRAEAAGVAAHISWVYDDAQTAALTAEAFDCVYSRFGVMFFSDPEAAFANLARTLRPGGRIAFVCWKTAADNPWLTEPARAAAEHIEFPPPTAPGDPGPFSLGDPDRIRGLLGAAKLTELAVASHDVELELGGGDLDEATELLLEVGPVAGALRVAQANPEQRERVRTAVREALSAFRGPRGLRAPAGTWLVTARKA